MCDLWAGALSCKNKTALAIISRILRNFVNNCFLKIINEDELIGLIISCHGLHSMFSGVNTELSLSSLWSSSIENVSLLKKAIQFFLGRYRKDRHYKTYWLYHRKFSYPVTLLSTRYYIRISYFLNCRWQFFLIGIVFYILSSWRALFQWHFCKMETGFCYYIAKSQD